MKNVFIKIIIITLVLISVFGIWGPSVSLALMNSANYINWMDSLNFGGEETSSSATYQLHDTLGEIGTGKIGSANYSGLIGFRQADADPKMIFTVSTNTIDFGVLSRSAVSTSDVTIVSSTNATDGYVTTIYDDGNLRSGAVDIDNVTDGSVTAGSEEYGVRTAGADGQMNGADTGLSTSPQVVASHSSWVDGSSVTITFKVAISSTTAAGAYSHIVTMVSTGRF